MAAPSLSSLFAAGVDILNTVIDATTRTIVAQVGDVGAQKADSDAAEWWQHVGFLSRPPKPKAQQAAAQAVTFRAGDRDVCIASRDLRGQALAGSLGYGETCVYAPGSDGAGQARILLKSDGSITLYTTSDGTSSGQSVAVQVSQTGIRWVTPWGAMTLDSAGFQVALTSGGAAFKVATDGSVAWTGTKTQAATAQGSLGVAASAATPVVNGPIGMTAIGSTSWFVSP
jgi:hypothetical protein